MFQNEAAVGDVDVYKAGVMAMNSPVSICMGNVGVCSCCCCVLGGVGVCGASYEES